MVKSLFNALTITILVLTLSFSIIQPTYSASGGRIGGGNFNSNSIPKINFEGNSNYSNSSSRGLALPFVVPFLGFGGGGLFGFLILIAISGSVINSIKRSNKNAQNNSSTSIQSNQASINIVQFQIALLASAKNVQIGLRDISSDSLTGNSEDLRKVLEESVLLILRSPELWVYSSIEEGNVPLKSAETAFNRISINERSKLDAEITSNFAGKILQNNIDVVQPGNSGSENQFILVSFLIASKTDLQLNTNPSSEDVKKNLLKIGAISTKDLVAMEILWQPEGECESLSAEELVLTYPNLKHL